MTLSLYDVSVGSYLQVLDACGNVLDKGRDYARDKGLDPAELVETRLHPEMLPLRFQIVSVWHHSLGALRGVQEGIFSPPPSKPELDYAGLRGLVVEAAEGLRELSRDEVESLAGKSMKFKVGDFEMPFLAEDFILTFSLPNFYFHATTTYDLLRMSGVPLGKMDFLGRMRIQS